MKPFKKLMKRLSARQAGCVAARGSMSKSTSKLNPETALKMPGSFKRK